MGSLPSIGAYSDRFLLSLFPDHAQIAGVNLRLWGALRRLFARKGCGIDAPKLVNQMGREDP